MMNGVIRAGTLETTVQTACFSSRKAAEKERHRLTSSFNKGGRITRDRSLGRNCWKLTMRSVEPLKSDIYWSVKS